MSSRPKHTHTHDTGPPNTHRPQCTQLSHSSMRRLKRTHNRYCKRSRRQRTDRSNRRAALVHLDEADVRRPNARARRTGGAQEPGRKCEIYTLVQTTVDCTILPTTVDLYNCTTTKECQCDVFRATYRCLYCNFLYSADHRALVVFVNTRSRYGSVH